MKNEYNLISLLKESLLEDKSGPIDELGKFWIVLRPKKGQTTKDEIVKECTIFNIGFEIVPEETIGAFKSRSDANREATQAIKNYDSELNELEGQMDEFRKTKSDLDAKKEAAVERIKKMKGE